MIEKASELNFADKKIRMILAGFPGIGKTTLALSAPKPLLIDLDKGLDRVEAPYRTDRICPNSVEELMKDLEENAKDYETIVVDTGGKLLDFFKPIVIKENAQNGQRDGSLSLKGWGAVSVKFANFMDFVYRLNKHVILIFHAKEDKDGDNTKLRISIEGSTKDKIWESMDLGGFVEMQGKNRTIGFSNCERYFAKGTHSIKGIYTIPTLEKGAKNDFLTKLFAKYIADLQSEVKAEESEIEIYNKAMSVKKIINGLKTVDQFNTIFKNIQNIPHALTSKIELETYILAKAKELGITYDSKAKTFTQGNC